MYTYDPKDGSWSTREVTLFILENLFVIGINLLSSLYYDYVAWVNELNSTSGVSNRPLKENEFLY